MTNPTFVAVDIETANCDHSSICQIGVVHVHEGTIQDRWATLINPRDWFDPWNVELHNIDEDVVKDSPLFSEISEHLASRLDGSTAVTYTRFVHTAVEQALIQSGINNLGVTWLDGSKVVRRAWPDSYARRGYGIRNVADDLGITLHQRSALESAQIAAEIVIHACKDTGLELADWLNRIKRPIYNTSVNRTGRPGGPFYGESIVFTGALSITRREAADIAAEAGCDVAKTVTKKQQSLWLEFKTKHDSTDTRKVASIERQRV